MLVLKYEDPHVLLFLTPIYPPAVLCELWILRIVVLFNES